MKRGPGPFMWCFEQEERNMIISCLREKGITQESLARRLSIHQTTVSKILRGKPRFDPLNLPTKIYHALNKPSELTFLENYQPRACEDSPGSPGHPDYALWKLLYNRNVRVLESLYLSASTETRGAIIGDLEKLIEKYKPK